MRIGGLASGMDIDALVEKLMNAERAPLNKLNQKKTTYEWQRDAYRGVNTKLKTFDTYIADNLVLKSMNSKTATSSNSSLVSATATGKASGTLSIEGVSQLATAARTTGDQISAIGSTKMNTIATGTIEFKANNASGTMPTEGTKIEITDDMTVDQFINKVNESNAGVSAIFENGRFSFTAKNTGKGSIEINGDVGNMQLTSKEGQNAVFQVNGIATERSSNTFTINGYSVTLKDTFNSTQTIADKYKAAKLELENATNNVSSKQLIFSNAKVAYNGLTNVNSYTSGHNNAYTAAFGETLNLSEQQTYNTFGKEFWSKLSAEEMTLINSLNGADTSETIKSNIDGSSLSAESKEKLKSLTPEKLKTLATLTSSDLTDYKVQANYSTYGTKLKDFDGTSINAINSFAYNSNESIETIHANIDNNTNFTDKVKSTLKSLSKEDLTNLLATDSTTIKKYHEKAKADDLKQQFNSVNAYALAEHRLNEATAKMTDLGITDPNATLTEEQQKAKESYDSALANKQSIWNQYSEEQKNTWNTLASKQPSFVELAGQNFNRSVYVAADNELEAAKTRLNTAVETEKTAKADALATNVIDASGATIQSTIDTAPKTQAVTMTSTTNVDDMMTKIKEFVNTYNGLVKDLNDQTKQTKYRDYTPLTAEQKKDMDEDEIKLWEEKAKSGLLRNDSLIRNGLSNMRSLIYQTNHGIEDSRYNTLFSVWITTSKSYNEGGTLEIDEAKLRKALEENPDAVDQLFKNTDGKKDATVQVKDKDDNLVTQIADTRGYLDKLRESMKALEINIEKKAGRSTMTDAQYSIGKGLMDTETRIKTWQDKLKNIEARYWKQFTAMESAINKSNQQSSMFAQG